MWPFSKKTRPRRAKARKAAPARTGPFWHRLRRAGHLGPLLLGAAFYIGALLMDAWPAAPLPYRRGQYVPADIPARVTFRVLAPKRMAELIERQRNATPATFRLNTALLDEQILHTLRGLPQRLKPTTQPAALDDAIKTQFGIDTPEQLNAWRGYADPPRRQEYEAQLARLRAQLLKTYLVRYEEAQQRTAWHVELVAGPEHQMVEIRDLIDLKDTVGIQQELPRIVGVLDPSIQGGAQSFLLATFTQGERLPLYRYDDAATQKRTEQLLAALRANPPDQVYDDYKAGNPLVHRGKGAPATRADEGLAAAELELLRHEHEAYLQQEHAERPWLLWARVVGRAGVLLVVAALLCLYVAYDQREVLQKRWGVFAAVAVLLGMLGVNKIMAQLLNWDPNTAVLPVLMAATILTIAHNQRLGLMLGLMLSVLVVLQLRADFSLFVVLLAGLTACVFQLREIRTRSKLIKTAAITGVVVVAAIWATALVRSIPWRFALLDSLWGLGFTILGGFVIQVALPVIERVFRIATSMTLLEWCDASKPLLKRLAMDAPGTYNHSLQLGAMCEVAAETVAARGLLARVGAYYHDIGKINKPDYFVENQPGAASKHAKLSPAMSLLVIIGHVKDGLEMARTYGVPQVLREFIAAHHGTTLVQYFYKAATEQRKNGADRPPAEAEFRYPGPKPRSKEVAILMLADAAESSVRSISEPTPGRIENQVHTMVTRRLMDGQLDECDLTLREVHQIEASLTKSLCGIYHARIAYPTPAGEEPSAAETASAKGQEGTPRAAAEPGPESPTTSK